MSQTGQNNIYLKKGRTLQSRKTQDFILPKQNKGKIEVVYCHQMVSFKITKQQVLYLYFDFTRYPMISSWRYCQSLV